MREKFKVLYSEEVILKRVKELAQEIKPYLEKYNSDDVVIIGLLKGVIFFFVDLIRALGSPDYRVELIKASSYQGQESTGKVNIQGEIGNIEDKVVILVDDIVATGSSLVEAAAALKKAGAKKIYAAITHGILSKGAIEKLNKSSIYHLVITDSIPLPEEKKTEKIRVISVGKLFAEAIKRIHEETSVSDLFI